MAVALASTFTLIACLLHFAHRSLPLDHPNERSLHSQPRPKIGGLAIMTVTLFLAALTRLNVPATAVAASAALMLVAMIDDVRNLPASVRLASHLAAACALVFAVPAGNVFLAALAVATMVWMSNLYNFMDGADGLAGGMTVIGFGSLAIAADASGATGLTIWCAIISAAALAFLIFNFPPAWVFMGDAGAVPLGFLAGALGYIGFINGVWPFWYPPLVFSPFILDASITLFRRLNRKEKPWIAHREHLYQRLIVSGWSHRKLALASFVLMLAVNAGSYAALSQPTTLQMVIIAAIVGGLAGVFLMAERYLRRRVSSQESVAG